MDSTSRDRLNAFLKFVVDNRVSATELQKVVPVLKGEGQAGPEVESLILSRSLPPLNSGTMQPREGGQTRKLTIGMATYDDYDGVYFTVQAIRLYHPEILEEVEFVIPAGRPSRSWETGFRTIATFPGARRPGPLSGIACFRKPMASSFCASIATF